MENENANASVHVPEKERYVTTGTTMGDFPKELVNFILEKLVAELISREKPTLYNNLSAWNTAFKSVIRYRSVCSTWAAFLDEILESHLLSWLTVWGPPHEIFELFPYLSLPKILVRFGNQACESPVPCPSPLISASSENPFVASSLIITCPGTRSRHQQTIQVENLFSNFGHHLSILNLDGLELKLELFVKILKAAFNLQALLLNRMKVFGNPSSSSCPVLPQLKILLLDLDPLHLHDEEWKQKVPPHSYFIEPYANHLAKLEIRYPTPVVVPLPKLEQLTITWPDVSTLQQNGGAVRLHHLAISFDSMWEGNIRHIFAYIDQFSETLVDLYLDVCWHDLTIGDWTTRDRLKQLNSVESLRDSDPVMLQLRRLSGRLATSQLKFPHLKKLGVPYPKEEIDVLLLSQSVLPKFPALEELHLLRFRQPYYEAIVYSPGQETIAPLLEREDYWSSCANLRKITVQLKDPGEDNPWGQERTCSYYRPATR